MFYSLNEYKKKKKLQKIQLHEITISENRTGNSVYIALAQNVLGILYIENQNCLYYLRSKLVLIEYCLHNFK